MRLPLLPQHSFVLAEAEKTHSGAMASHGILLNISLPCRVMCTAVGSAAGIVSRLQAPFCDREPEKLKGDRLRYRSFCMVAELR